MGLNLVQIFKYINRFNSFKINLCCFLYDSKIKNYRDLFSKDGWNFEVGNAAFIHYQNGKAHREDGPAFVYLNPITVDYAIHGSFVHAISNEDFVRRNKMKAFW